VRAQAAAQTRLGKRRRRIPASLGDIRLSRTLNSLSEALTFPPQTDASTLIEGERYFAVHFIDNRMLVPELRPLVFIGLNRYVGDSGQLYFQDAASYATGARFEAATDETECEIHVVDVSTPFVYEFDRALDVLLRCSLQRQQSSTAASTSKRLGQEEGFE
jgi:hypothetical protein